VGLSVAGTTELSLYLDTTARFWGNSGTGYTEKFFSSAFCDHRRGHLISTGSASGVCPLESCERFPLCSIIFCLFAVLWFCLRTRNSDYLPPGGEYSFSTLATAKILL